MTYFDPVAPYKGNIAKVWEIIMRIPDGDVPAWVDEQIAEIEMGFKKSIRMQDSDRPIPTDDLIAEIEAFEKAEGIETVRTPEKIDALLDKMTDQLMQLHEALPLDELEGENWRKKAIERLEKAQNYLMLKAELLRRKEFTKDLKPSIPKKGSRRADTRIIWISRKRTPAEFLQRLPDFIAIPDYIALNTVVRAHFFIPSVPTPMLPGFPSQLRWLGDLKVLAFLFDELGKLGYIRKGQLKKVAFHFVDNAGQKIKYESFATLTYKPSETVDDQVEYLISNFMKII